MDYKYSHNGFLSTMNLQVVFLPLVRAMAQPSAPPAGSSQPASHSWDPPPRKERTRSRPRQPGLRGLGFRVWGLGFRVWGLGFGVWGLGFRV